MNSYLASYDWCWHVPLKLWLPCSTCMRLLSTSPPINVTGSHTGVPRPVSCPATFPHFLPHWNAPEEFTPIYVGRGWELESTEPIEIKKAPSFQEVFQLKRAMHELDTKFNGRTVSAFPKLDPDTTRNSVPPPSFLYLSLASTGIRRLRVVESWKKGLELRYAYKY